MACAVGGLSYPHVPCPCVLYHCLREFFLLVCDIDVLEREVMQVVLVAFPHVEEVAALHLYVPHRDVVAFRERHVVPLLWFEELCPWPHDDEAPTLSGHVLDGDILIVLWCVGSHLEPYDAVRVLGMAPPDDYVAVVERLRP